MSSPTLKTHDLSRLLSHVCAQLWQRIRTGEDGHVEDYLQQYPALAERQECVLRMARVEMLARRRNGQSCPSDEWLRRFPQWTDGLRALFATDPVSPGATPTRGTPTSPEGDHSGPSFDKYPVVGDYELLEELGHGGMGVVYRARHCTLGRIVALKTLRNRERPTTEELERFCREARAISQLHHPHVVPLFEFGRHQGCPFYTMTLIPGGSLASQKERFRGDIRSAIGLIEKIARGVAHAHDHGLVHRDIKPSNVLMDADGEPLVSDFGLVRFLEATTELTRTGQELGTPAYMAPEQIHGRSEEISQRTDVWALGVLAYEVITGQRPFHGRDRRETEDRILQSEPVTPSDACPSVDRDLEAILLHCLEKDPKRRYSTAGELADDLQRWQAGALPSVRPMNWGRRRLRSLRRHPWRVAALLLLLLAAGTIPFLIPNDPPITPPPEPRNLLAEYDATLRAGGQVVLVPEHGPPPWSEWTLRHGNVVETGPGGVFTFGDDGATQLMLLPTPPVDRYRFTAEVCHVQARTTGKVGLFFLDAKRMTRPGTAHVFATWTFNDPPPNRALKTSKPFVTLFVRRFQDGMDRSESYAPVGRTFAPTAGGWHELRVDVVADAVRCSFDGQFVGAAPFTTLGPLFKQAAALEPPVEVELSPRGGLGLFTLWSTASFRNVRLEPLP